MPDVVGLYMVMRRVRLVMVALRDGSHAVGYILPCGPIVLKPPPALRRITMKARSLLLCTLVLAAACAESPTSARTTDARRADSTTPCEKGGMTMGGGQVAPCP